MTDVVIRLGDGTQAVAQLGAPVTHQYGAGLFHVLAAAGAERASTDVRGPGTFAITASAGPMIDPGPDPEPDPEPDPAPPDEQESAEPEPPAEPESEGAE